MKRLYALLTILIFSASLTAATTKNAATEDSEEQNELLDDWQYNELKTAAEQLSVSQNNAGFFPALVTGGLASPSLTAASNIHPQQQIASTARMKHMGNGASKRLGFAVGGAKDSGNFIQNIENGYLPKYDSITYEGLFYEYYFDTGIGNGTCNELFCPSYSTAVTKDFYSDETNYYLSVGLNSGLHEEHFQRKKLNIVVVLDISGSMGSSFKSYHYDNTKSESAEARKSKMQLANEAIVAMIEHLNNDDRFGVVLFDNRAFLAKPLRLISKTDMNAIAKHILALREKGGTNWQAGYNEGVKLFSSLNKNITPPEEYENRIIFLTDAMPNTGELRRDSLFSMVRDASKNGIYTSIFGVGVDFNPELVEYVTKTRGANYFTVQSADEFKKRLADEFDFMVTPLVFDLELQLKSSDYTITGIFGAPDANMSSGEIMKINTLFPSAVESEQVKGGVILIKLKKTGNSGSPISLIVHYKDPRGKLFTVTDNVILKNKFGFANPGIHKAVLLTEYVSLLKNWLIDARVGCNNKRSHSQMLPLTKCGIPYPATRPETARLPTWERTSCSLNVSEGYRHFFTLFTQYFKKEMEKIKDPILKKELNILTILTSACPRRHNSLI